MDETAEKSRFVEEQRKWLMLWREQTGISWPLVAKRTGLKQGTISQFGSEKGYYGKKLSSEYPIAEKVARFRHALEKQEALASELPEAPGYFPTETSEKLEVLLDYARMGLVTAASLEAGCGKTQTASAYARKTPNVFHVELRKSAGGANNMLKMVLATMGVKDPKGGTFDMSAQVCEILKKLGKPLIIFDEAQHLTEASIEEIRSWNDTKDASGVPIVGIGFFGSIGILQKLARYAQLSSRINFRHEQLIPTAADIEALADAWRVTEEQSRKQLHVICSRFGGLRNGTSVLLLATRMALAEDVPLGHDHLQDAWAELDFRAIAA